MAYTHDAWGTLYDTSVHLRTKAPSSRHSPPTFWKTTIILTSIGGASSGQGVSSPLAVVQGTA